MKSKTSLFKASLIRKNFLRFWPVTLAYFAILFFIVPFPMYTNDVSRIEILNLLQTAQFPVFTAVVAFFAALLCFSYLFGSRSCNMMHAFPLNRSQLFASNYISGILLMLVPQAVVLLIALPGIFESGLSGTALPWLLYSFGTTFVFYTIGVFCCMLAGHAFAAIVYYAFFNLAEGLMVLLYRLFIQENVFGMMEMRSFGSLKYYILSPLIYITMGCRLEYTADSAANGETIIRSVYYQGAHAVGIYCIAAAVLLAVTLVLYKKRALETAGEMSSFAFVRPLMRWVIAFGVGTAMAFFICAGTNTTLRVFILCFVIFSLAAFIFTEMVLRKNFRIFRKSILIEAVICTAVFTAIFLFLRSDPANLLNRVPDSEKIQSASVTGSYTIAKNDAEGIDAIRALHQSIIDNRSEYEQYNHSTYYGHDQEYVELAPLSFVYITKSGEAISRVYSVPVDAAHLADPESTASRIVSLEDRTDLCDYIFGIQSDKIRWKEGSFRDMELDAKTAEAVYSAYKKDILDGNVPYHTGDPEMYDSFQYNFPMSIMGSVKGGMETIYDVHGLEQAGRWLGGYGISPVWVDYSGEKEDGTAEVMSSFYLARTCTNTIEALTKAGVISGTDELERLIEE